MSTLPKKEFIKTVLCPKLVKIGFNPIKHKLSIHLDGYYKKENEVVVIEQIGSEVRNEIPIFEIRACTRDRANYEYKNKLNQLWIIDRENV